MKDFFGELFDLCGKDNKSSRGFYIIVTTALFLFALLSVASVVLLVVSLVSGVEVSVVRYIMSALPIAVTVGIVVWLKKS